MYLKLTKDVALTEGVTTRYNYSGIDISALTSAHVVKDGDHFIAYVGVSGGVDIPDGAAEITLEEYNNAVQHSSEQESDEITELKQAIAELTMMIAAPVGGDGR